MMTTTINRRQFIDRSTRAALALGAAGTLSRTVFGAEQPDSADAGKPPFPIIDTHQHLWDLSKLRLSWLKPGEPLTRNFTMKDYLAATAGLGIVRSVYMEVAVDVDCQLAEAEYILDICRRGDSPTVAAVIGGCPAKDSFRAYITRFKGNPFIKGVRQIPRDAVGGPSLYRQKQFVAGIRLLGELGMRFDLCSPPSGLPEAIALVDACPDTSFILDHCGNGDPQWHRLPDKDETPERVAVRQQAAAQWRRNVALLAERKNVVCKISGVVSRAIKGSWTPEDLAPIVNHCLDAFGPDRVMFASDWPVCTRVATLRQWVGALRQIVRNRSLEQQQKLFCDNAARVYGLANPRLS